MGPNYPPTFPSHFPYFHLFPPIPFFPDSASRGPPIKVRHVFSTRLASTPTFVSYSVCLPRSNPSPQILQPCLFVYTYILRTVSSATKRGHSTLFLLSLPHSAVTPFPEYLKPWEKFILQLHFRIPSWSNEGRSN